MSEFYGIQWDIISPIVDGDAFEGWEVNDMSKVGSMDIVDVDDDAAILATLVELELFGEGTTVDHVDIEELGNDTLVLEAVVDGCPLYILQRTRR